MMSLELPAAPVLLKPVKCSKYQRKIFGEILRIGTPGIGTLQKPKASNSGEKIVAKVWQNMML